MCIQSFKYWYCPLKYNKTFAIFTPFCNLLGISIMKIIQLLPICHSCQPMLLRPVILHEKVHSDDQGLLQKDLCTAHH